MIKEMVVSISLTGSIADLEEIGIWKMDGNEVKNKCLGIISSMKNSGYPKVKVFINGKRVKDIKNTKEQGEQIIEGKTVVVTEKLIREHEG